MFAVSSAPFRARRPDRPLFDEAKRLGIGFHLGYAELCEEDGPTRRFNTAILVGPDGAIVGKYRKIHLPGTAEPVADAPFQRLENRGVAQRVDRLDAGIGPTA